MDAEVLRLSIGAVELSDPAVPWAATINKGDYQLASPITDGVIIIKKSPISVALSQSRMGLEQVWQTPA